MSHSKKRVKEQVFNKLKRRIKQVVGSPTVIGDVLGVMGYYINYKRNIANGMSMEEALEALAMIIILPSSQEEIQKRFIAITRRLCISWFYDVW